MLVNFNYCRLWQRNTNWTFQRQWQKFWMCLMRRVRYCVLLTFIMHSQDFISLCKKLLCLYSPASDGGGAFYWSLYGDQRYKGYRYRVNKTDPFTNITLTTFAKNLFSSFCIYSKVWFAVCVLTGTSMIIVCRKLNCGKLTFFWDICANLGIIFKIIKWEYIISVGHRAFLINNIYIMS